MDTLTNEKQKLEPTNAELRAINSIKDINSLANVIAQLHIKEIGNSFSEGM